MSRYWVCGVVLGGLVASSCAGPMARSIYLPREGSETVPEGMPYALPATAIHVAVTPMADKKGASLALSTVPVPDPEWQFALVHHPSAFTSDTMEISATVSGLLTKVEGAADDKTVEVLGKVKNLGIAVAKLNTLAGMGVLQGAGMESKKAADRVLLARLAEDLETSFKEAMGRIPTVNRGWVMPGTLQWAAGPSGSTASLEPQSISPEWELGVQLATPVTTTSRQEQGASTWASARSGPGTDAGDSYDGVLTRSLEPYRVRTSLVWTGAISFTESVRRIIEDQNSNLDGEKTTKEPTDQESDTPVLIQELTKRLEEGTVPEPLLMKLRAELAPSGMEVKATENGLSARMELISQDSIAILPDYGRVVALGLDRAVFVKTEHTLTFSNGVVTGVKLNRPSSVAAIASFPLDVAQALVDLPAQLIQLRVSTIESEQSLADKEKELRDAEEAARKTESEARDAEEVAARNAYESAVAEADIAISAYESAKEAKPPDPDTERLKLRDARLAAMKANDAAAKAGVPKPFEVPPDPREPPFSAGD